MDTIFRLKQHNRQMLPIRLTPFDQFNSFQTRLLLYIILYVKLAPEIIIINFKIFQYKLYSMIGHCNQTIARYVD